MRHTYHAEQWLAHPLEKVFAFFADPENLPRLMSPWQQARIEQASYTPPPSTPFCQQALSHSILAGAGTRLTLSFRPIPFSPVRLSWDAEISEFEWNDHFCDIQLRGPFAFWRHCHRLRVESRTDHHGIEAVGTLLHDAVEYEMPFGLLGEVARRLVVERQLRSTFAYRQKRTAELLSPALPRTKRDEALNGRPST